MRSRWFSRRALGLHAALLCWSPGCLLAGWWQVTRALGGNSLSYLYSVEWPVFALVGVWGWWSLIHTDPETVGARAQQRALAQQALQARQVQPAEPPARSAKPPAQPAPGLTAPAQATPSGPPAPGRRPQEEDPTLAAYNDRLAALAASGATKTWRRR